MEPSTVARVRSVGHHQALHRGAQPLVLGELVGEAFAVGGRVVRVREHHPERSVELGLEGAALLGAPTGPMAAPAHRLQA